MSVDKLKQIGFYTLEDYRARNVCCGSPLWRCELLITSRCNFNCIYCRKRNAPDITMAEAIKVLNYWIKNGLQNVRFSGGEPTLHTHLEEMVYECACKGVKHIALSTNGSAPIGTYSDLIEYGVNDFSISLDSCCGDIGNAIANAKKWEHTVEAIKFCAGKVYTTVGIVVLDKNIDTLQETVDFAISLGVDDVRIISAAQWNKPLRLSKQQRNKHPILNYRLSNMEKGRNVRGLTDKDNHKCPLVLDDMAVENGYHYPCIIYLRERGNPIGKLSDDTLKERELWFDNHNCFEDSICKNNCLDVCIDYNNRVNELNRKLK